MLMTLILANWATTSLVIVIRSHNKLSFDDNTHFPGGPPLILQHSKMVLLPR